MKNILLAILAFLAILLVACSDDAKDTWEDYEEWRNLNTQWLEEQAQRKNPDGTPYYQKVVDPDNSLGYVLMHYFNDRAETEGNLTPMSTSRVNVRYHLSLYNDVPVDSSDLQTANGPGIFQTILNSNIIKGWIVAVCEMRVGDTAEVLMPFNMAYGMSGNTAVPPYSSLRFNIRLVDIVNYETRP